MKEEILFSRDCYLPELFQLCIRPQNRKEMLIHLQDFGDKFDRCFLESKYYEVFDVFGMYALDYTYAHNDADFLKALNAYLLEMKESYHNKRFIGVAFARSIRNFDVQLNEILFTNLIKDCLDVGLFGLIQFFFKFGPKHLLSESEVNISKMAKKFK